jgi:hypothetical protein
MQVFAAIVKGDQNVAMVALTKQAVLDLRRGHADDSGGVGLTGDAIGGSIKGASQRTVRRKNRRRSASQ